MACQITVYLEDGTSDSDSAMVTFDAIVARGTGAPLPPDLKTVVVPGKDGDKLAMGTGGANTVRVTLDGSLQQRELRGQLPIHGGLIVSDSVPDRSMIPTGDLFYIDLGIVVNRGGELVVEEMEESQLIRHQRNNDFNLAQKDAKVRYWIGADVGCPECSETLWDYLSYYPDDRERYVDDDGDFDWEARCRAIWRTATG